MRFGFLNQIDSRLRRARVQPLPQRLHRLRFAPGKYLDRAVREISRDAPKPKPLSLNARAVPEIDALNFTEDPEAANDLAQGDDRPALNWGAAPVSWRSDARR